jgi:tRNA modification GTPase
MERADTIVIVVDPTVQSDYNSELSLAKEHKNNVVIAINKIDIADPKALEQMEMIFREFNRCFVSAKTEEGLDRLKQMLVEPGNMPSIDNAPVINRYRHKQALEHANLFLQAAIELIDQNAFPEIVAEEVDSAITQISELTGEITSQDILDKIFSEFCIGK